MVMFNLRQDGQNVSKNASYDTPAHEAAAAMQDMMSMIDALRAAGTMGGE